METEGFRVVRAIREDSLGRRHRLVEISAFGEGVDLPEKGNDLGVRQARAYHWAGRSGRLCPDVERGPMILLARHRTVRRHRCSLCWKETFPAHPAQLRPTLVRRVARGAHG